MSARGHALHSVCPQLSVFLFALSQWFFQSHFLFSPTATLPICRYEADRVLSDTGDGDGDAGGYGCANLPLQPKLDAVGKTKRRPRRRQLLSGPTASGETAPRHHMGEWIFILINYTSGFQLGEISMEKKMHNTNYWMNENFVQFLAISFRFTSPNQSSIYQSLIYLWIIKLYLYIELGSFCLELGLHPIHPIELWSHPIHPIHPLELESHSIHSESWFFDWPSLTW